MAKRKESIRENRRSAHDKMSFKELGQTTLRKILGIKEASLPPAGASSRDEDAGFRRLSARSDKDLSPSSWQKQMNVAHFLWQQNPMAFRILELMTDFVVGDGFIYNAKDDGTKDVIKKHWDDPDNAWDLKQGERHMELGLFGTYLLMPFVNDHDGLVKLSPVDPGGIAEIIPDKDIAGKADFVKFANRASAELKTVKVIHQDTRQFIEEPNANGAMDRKENPSAGLLCGEIFYFSINKLSFTLHGTSDIYRQADWLDAFDQFVFSLLERIYFLNSHLYDISIENAGPDAIKDKVDELEANPPKPGGWRVHDSKEVWETLTPEMRSAEVNQIAKVIKMTILGSIGIPLHWYGSGEDTNKASAVAMGGPIHRKLKRKQSVWAEVLRTIIQFQIDKAIEKGYLTKNLPDGTKRDLSFEIIAPDISAKEMGEFVTALGSLTDTLAIAVSESFIGRPDAAKAFITQLSELGIEVEDPDKQDVEQNADDEQKREEKTEEEEVEETYRQAEAIREAAKKKEKPSAVSASS